MNQELHARLWRGVSGLVFFDAGNVWTDRGSTNVDLFKSVGMGFRYFSPIGPLRLCDAIGLDTILHVMEILYREYGDTKYRPCPLLRKYVEAGWLGKKAGRGFYNDYKK